MKDLTLIYPQWQGSIDNEALYNGAYNLSENIQGLPSPHEVEVASFYEISRHGPIAGEEDIINQLHNACEILDSENPERILLLGGDCSTDSAPATWLNHKFGDSLALIWFDAHPDLNTPETSQSGRLQGMALSTVLGMTGNKINEVLSLPLKPAQIFCAGPRVFDPPELDFLTTNKISFFGPGELERDPAYLARKIVQAGYSKVYIHLDVDAVNPMGFPHCKPSPPAGLLFGNLLKIIEELHIKLKISGLGITEFHPGNARGIEKVKQLIEKALPDFIK